MKEVAENEKKLIEMLQHKKFSNLSKLLLRLIIDDVSLSLCG